LSIGRGRWEKGYLKSPPSHVGDVGRNNTVGETLRNNIGSNESEEFLHGDGERTNRGNEGLCGCVEREKKKRREENIRRQGPGECAGREGERNSS